MSLSTVTQPNGIFNSSKVGVTRDLAMLAVLAAVFLIASAPQRTGPIDLRWDAGAYYVLGTSIAEGHGYRLLNEPGHIQAIQYPPLLPAFLAAVQVLAGSHDPVEVGTVLRFLFLLLFAGYILFAYLVARRYVSPVAALAVGLICVLNPYTHFISEQATADLPFAFTVVAFVFFASAKRSRTNGVLTCALCVASYLLRTAGIALMAAWIGDALLKHQFRPALRRILICAVPVIAWNGYVAAVERGAEYRHPAYSYQRADYLFYNVSYLRNAMLKDPDHPEGGKVTAFGVLTDRILPNVWKLPVALGETVTSAQGFWDMQWWSIKTRLPRLPLPNLLINPILIVIGILVLFGSGVCFVRGHKVIVLYVLFSIMLICATPWASQMARYLISLRPFIALFFVMALLSLNRIVQQRARMHLNMLSFLAMCLSVAIVVGQASWGLRQMYGSYHSPAYWRTSAGRSVRYKLFFYEPSYKALDGALDWVRENAKPGDVLASSIPHWAYLRTGLPSVMIPFDRDNVSAQHDLDSVPVAFVVVQRGAPIDAKAYVGGAISTASAWRMVYSDGGEYVSIYHRID